MKMKIAVRAYTKSNKKAKEYERREEDIPNFDKIFVFDTETRNDERQALTFGSFVIYNKGILGSIGLFYDPETVTEQELSSLIKYCEKDSIIRIFTLQEFIEQIFYPNVYYEQVPCITFNQGFDLSRLAIGYGEGRKKMHNGFTLKLSRDEKVRPPITVKQNNSDTIARFQYTKFSKFKGHFVDCQIFATVLTDRKHISLKDACKEFNKKHQKIEVAEHGKINEKYIQYNLEDTLATAELFTQLKIEYERYGIDLPITKIHSAASMGKALLEQLGIRPFMELNPNFPSHILGKAMQTYYGGRCEARIRKTPVQVATLDFSSMYPSLFILMGLYKFLVAERIDYKDETKQVRRLLETITIEQLQKPETWEGLNVIVEIEPEDDLLPVRAPYDKDTLTVGLNYLTSKKTIWYGLPSLILSKLLTGKIPKIKKAIRFIPIGKQKTLRKATILGMEIDPNRDNIFKLLVEERAKAKKLGEKSRAKAIKILVNATSYGIFIELNRDEVESELTIFSGNEKFSDKKRLERQGKYFCPIIGTLITDGSKLLLGLGDYMLQSHNEVVAYLDTDSMAVPVKYKKEIVSFYDPLNPYKKELIEHLLKEEEKKIWLYAISAKRYALYTLSKKGIPRIKEYEDGEDYSLHGLGHLMNPFSTKNGRWQKQVWEDILKLHYGKIDEDSFLAKYRQYYAVSQFTISTATLMRRFAPLNKDKSYRDSVKPFNFFNIGFGNKDEVKPIAPFSKDSQEMPHSEFIDYRTGRRMTGLEYFKSLEDELSVYIKHPESKLDGDEGRLERKHIVADRMIYIGKEADKLEENDYGFTRTSYNEYSNPKELLEIFSRPWKEVKNCGLSRMQFYRIREQIKKGKKSRLNKATLIKLKKVL